MCSDKQLRIILNKLDRESGIFLRKEKKLNPSDM